MEAVTAQAIDRSVAQSRVSQPLRDAREAPRDTPAGPTDVLDTKENRSKVHSTVQALNLFHENRDNTRFEYRVNPEFGTLQVTLLNFMTGEVVQQIPSSKILEFAKKMHEMSGLIVEEHA